MQRRFLRGRLAIGDWRLRRLVGVILFCGIAATGSLAYLRAAGQTNVDHDITVSYSTVPDITNILVNNGNAITLTANTTTTVSVGYTISDADGCGDVLFNGNVTSTLYRSGVSGGASCLASTLNCYIVASTSTHSCANPTSTTQSVSATTTFYIYYFADATDASSTYPSEGWLAQINVRDSASNTGVATSSQVELNSLLAVDLGTSTLNYGSLYRNTNTTSTNQESQIFNAGNTSTTLRISGTALVSGSNSIATSSQHYATSTFTFGGAEQSLSDAATLVDGFLAPGLPLGPSWTNAAPYTQLAGLRGVGHNGYVYVSGGTYDTVIYSTVSFATTTVTGSINGWTSTTAMPTSRTSHNLVARNGYLYAVGGIVSAGGSTSSVIFAPINATGSIGSWSTTASLLNFVNNSEVVVNGNYIYVIGGMSIGNVATSTVYYATFNSTGSISNWSSTTPLPSAINSHAAVAFNGYIYKIGGSDSAANATATVFYAPINSTGSIGSWSTATQLPNTLTSFSAVTDNGRIYIIGGKVTSSPTSTVLFAPVNSNGALGNWTRITSLPAALSNYAVAATKGYVYEISGALTIDSTTTVRFNRLPSMNTYWGVTVPATSPDGSYTSTVTYTAVFTP